MYRSALSNLPLPPVCRAALVAVALAAGIATPAHALGPFQAWSTVGSTGTVDEGSTSVVSMGGAGINFLAGTTYPRTVTVRYPVVDVWGANPAPTWIGARFSDNGTSSRILLTLRRLGPADTVATDLATWDSDLFAPSASPQFAWAARDCTLQTMDFANYTYWIEAAITRTSSSGNASLSQIRLDNFAGTCVAAENSQERRQTRVE